MILAWAVPAGLAIGLSLGALGGGGSILTVPALVYLMHQDAHAATAGSLIVVGVTATAGAVSHWRAGRVRIAAGSLFGLLGVAGSYVGSRLSTAVGEQVLLAGFAVLMIVAAAAMLCRRGATQAPRTAPPRHRWPHDLTIAVTATAVGLLTGFFGVGGGFVIVPALVVALGFDMPTAIGTSLLVIAINSAAALLARTGDLHVDWTLIGVFTGFAIVGALLGRRIADRTSERTLTLTFATLLLALSGFMLARTVPALV